MAEAFGLAAGVVGVASLAIQLAESATKIKRFCNDVRDAPQLLADIAESLETFSLMLNLIEKQAARHVDRIIVERCLKRCEQIVSRVTTITVKLEGMSRIKHVRAVLKKPQLMELCQQLSNAKVDLGLAYNLYVECCRQHDFAALSHAVGQLSITPSMGFPSSAKVAMTDIRRSKQGPITTKTFTLQPWLLSKVWTVSLSVAASGWTISLRTANVVPHDSVIFGLCMDGNLSGVQKLLASGKASLYDQCRSDDGYHTVFSTAAMSGNVHLCRWLLESTSVPQTANVQNPLTAFTPILSKDNEQQYDEMYRLFLPHLADYLDILTTSNENRPDGDLLCECPTVQGLELVKTHCSLYSTLSLNERFSKAIKAIRYRLERYRDVDPALFMCILDDDLESIADVSRALRTSFLHLIADVLHSGAMRKSDPSVIWRWRDLVSRVLLLGADVHATEYGHTALRAILWRGRPDMDGSVLTTYLKIWIAMLDSSGVDLSRYGTVERRALLSMTSDPDWILDWTSGSNIDDWGVVPEQASVIVPLYVLEAPAGTWSAGTETICWRPDPSEDDELGSWRHLRDVKLAKVSGFAPSPPVQDLDFWWTRSQDDAGECLQEIRRMLRPRSHAIRRSYSQPRTIKDAPFWPNWCLSWYTTHRCIDGVWHMECNERDVEQPLNGRTSRSFWRNHRQCAKAMQSCGRHEKSTPYLRIRHQMTAFMRRFGTREELDALPYAAYRRIWANPKEYGDLGRAGRAVQH